MNIILKSFDCQPCRQFIEHALQDFTIGTCISVLEDQSYQPNVGAAKNEWLYAPDIRKGQYPVHWAEVTPIDEELIENMRGCEAVFMNMISRYAHSEEIPYGERKRRYFAHLQYWNHVLETEKIDLLLLNHVPHMAWDYVIYELCKYKRIHTLHLERCAVINALMMLEHWETTGEDAWHKYQEICAQYKNQDDIPLSRQYEWFYESQTQHNIPPVGSFPNPQFRQKYFLLKWYKKGIKVLRMQPQKFFIVPPQNPRR